MKRAVEIMDIDHEIEKDVKNLGNEVQDLVHLYYQEVKQIPLLSEEEEKELLIRKLHGDENARKRLIEANLRLVIWVLARYYRNVTSMEFLDLIQEGNLGLMKGIDKMDPSRNCRISTYVPYYIRSQISFKLATSESKLSHSYQMGQWIQKIKREEKAFQLQYGHLPTQEEVASSLKLSLKKVKEIYRTMAPMIELNSFSTVLEQTQREEVIADPRMLSPEEQYIQKAEHEMLYGLLEHFSERDRELITSLLGLEDGICHIERELAERFGITKARVGQIRDKLNKYQDDSQIQSMFEDNVKSIPTSKIYQKKR